MVLPIRWSPKAAHQLETIVEYIAQDSERYAAIFTRRLLQVVRVNPNLPRRRPCRSRVRRPRTCGKNSTSAIGSSTVSPRTPSKSSPSATAPG